MVKAKLNQIAATWVNEEHNTKKNSDKVSEKQGEEVKKKQTFNLKEGTINRLWTQRIKTGKTISKIIDELVSVHLPIMRLEEIKEK